MNVSNQLNSVLNKPVAFFMENSWPVYPSGTEYYTHDIDDGKIKLISTGTFYSNMRSIKNALWVKLDVGTLWTYTHSIVDNGSTLSFIDLAGVRMKKGVIHIGKITILSFLDTEEQIMDQVRSIIRNENNVEYTEIMPKSVLYFKDLKIQLKEQEVYRKDKRISLSHQEFLALWFLTEHPGWVCTKEQIYGAVCEEKYAEDIDNIIYCLIRSLRKKLETDPRHPEYIQTIRGVGYKFVIPEE